MVTPLVKPSTVAIAKKLQSDGQEIFGDHPLPHAKAYTIPKTIKCRRRTQVTFRANGNGTNGSSP